MGRDPSNFISECYFVTHKIFTRTAWCQYRLDPAEWSKEKNFLEFYIGRIIQLQDIELLGEFIQTLKCLGVTEKNNVLKNALQFMMSKYDRQNVSTVNFFSMMLNLRAGWLAHQYRYL